MGYLVRIVARSATSSLYADRIRIGQFCLNQRILDSKDKLVRVLTIFLRYASGILSVSNPHNFPDRLPSKRNSIYLEVPFFLV